MASQYILNPDGTVSAKEVSFVLRNSSELSGAEQSFRPDPQAQGEYERQKQRKYGYDIIQYPSDLGEGTRHPYYMTFYINIQDLSRFAKKGEPNDLVARVGENQSQTIRSQVQINQGQYGGLTKNLGDSNVGFGRKTSRTKAAIRLFVPDTLSWSYENRFRDPSLSGTPALKTLQQGGEMFKGGQSFVDDFQKSGFVTALANLGKNAQAGPLAEAAGDLVLGDAGLGLSAFGLAVNPQIDVIYDSPNLRSFTFEFMMAPRSANEARTIRQIINLFKFHAAPEVFADGGVFGRYFVPPSEFDIEFSMTSMGEISTCVLNNITVDYGSSGAAFYSDENPVYTRLTLQFTELEYMTRDFIDREINGKARG